MSVLPSFSAASSKARNVLWLVGLVVLCLSVFSTEVAIGQQRVSPTDPHRFFVWSVNDVKALVPAVRSQRMAYSVATTGGLLATLTYQDDDLARNAEEWAVGSGRPALRVLDELGNVRAVRPVAIMLFLGSLTTNDTRFQDAAFTSLQSIVFSNLFTDGLKTIAGRARPHQQQGSTHFRPFSGNLSFPSGHSTTVFAFTVPWYMYYPNRYTAGLVVLGAGTSFTRIVKDAHWFTDVLAGSVIGSATAYWLSARHQGKQGFPRFLPVVSFNRMGLVVQLGY